MQKLSFYLISSFLVLFTAEWVSSQELTKDTFPYGPLGLNSLPWIVAKERHFFEKTG